MMYSTFPAPTIVCTVFRCHFIGAVLACGNRPRRADKLSGRQFEDRAPGSRSPRPRLPPVTPFLVDVLAVVITICLYVIIALHSHLTSGSPSVVICSSCYEASAPGALRLIGSPFQYIDGQHRENSHCTKLALGGGQRLAME